MKFGYKVRGAEEGKGTGEGKRGKRGVMESHIYFSHTSYNVLFLLGTSIVQINIDNIDNY